MLLRGVIFREEEYYIIITVITDWLICIFRSDADTPGYLAFIEIALDSQFFPAIEDYFRFAVHAADGYKEFRIAGERLAMMGYDKL